MRPWEHLGEGRLGGGRDPAFLQTCERSSRCGSGSAGRGRGLLRDPSPPSPLGRLPSLTS